MIFGGYQYSEYDNLFYIVYDIIYDNNATSSIDIDNIAISNNQLMNSQFIQHQHQSLSAPLVQQSVSGTQHPLLRSLAQQPRI